MSEFLLFLIDGTCIYFSRYFFLLFYVVQFSCELVSRCVKHLLFGFVIHIYILSVIIYYTNIY